MASLLGMSTVATFITFQKFFLTTQRVLPLGIFSAMLAWTTANGYIALKPNQRNYFLHRLSQTTANFRLAWQQWSSHSIIHPSLPGTDLEASGSVNTARELKPKRPQRSLIPLTGKRGLHAKGENEGTVSLKDERLEKGQKKMQKKDADNLKASQDQMRVQNPVSKEVPGPDQVWGSMPVSQTSSEQEQGKQTWVQVGRGKALATRRGQTMERQLLLYPLDAAIPGYFGGESQPKGNE